MTRRARILTYGSAGLLVVAGIAGAVLFHGLLGQLLAMILIGLGLVLATSLVFYEVGLSEDRELAREEVERQLPRTAMSAPARPRPRPRPRLERMRGQARRLK